MCASQPPEAGSTECGGCGKPMAVGVEVCPHCGRRRGEEGQRPAGVELRPLGGEVGPAGVELRPLGGEGGTAARKPAGPSSTRASGRPVGPPSTGASARRAGRAPAGPPTESRGEPGERASRRGGGSAAEYFSYAKEVVKGDPLFAVLLGVIGLGALYSLVMGSLFAAGILCLVFWGLLTFNHLVYLIVVVLTGLSLVSSVLGLLISPPGWGLALLNELTGLVWLGFVLAVLFKRSDHFA